MTTPANPDEVDRFASKYLVVGDCWLWQSPLDKDGYGSFYFRRRSRRAHRVAWFLHRGPIPSGLVVNHVCKNRHCVNPQHLELLTARENALQDSLSPASLNVRKTHCKQGHEFDRVYGGQRYCSVCDAEKARRLRARWRAEDDIAC
jgi:hypothetical protein